jgi:DNA-binding XRE family transcriptional regulator
MLKMVTQTKLKQLRLELNPPVTQEDFARHAGLRMKTYSNAERGHNCSYSTAQSILVALNGLRGTRGMSALVLDDLELKIV